MVTLLKTTEAPWHPWPAYRPFVEPLFPNAAVVEAATWDGRVQGPLTVSVADEWDRPISDQAAGRLVEWVHGGGNLLVLHHGISLQARPELAALIGGRFAGHPPAGVLTFRVPGGAPWTMTDEPYRFEAVGDVVPLLEYEHEGHWYLAGWEHRAGLGRVVYLMPGHVPQNFSDAAYRDLILSHRDRLSTSR